MKRLTTISIIIICLVCSIYGQETNTTICTNKAIEKVNSRGVKIGLKIDEVLNLFNLTEEEKQRILNNANASSKVAFGSKGFVVYPKLNDEKFDGISGYSFGFLDDRLVSFNVGYSKPKWKDANQFGSKIIKFFDLPKIENWESNAGSLNIQCENHYIRLYASNSSSSFSISDTRVRIILEEREQKILEEKREKEIKAFKP
jgi:hypothetical protein